MAVDILLIIITATIIQLMLTIGKEKKEKKSLNSSVMLKIKRKEIGKGDGDYLEEFVAFDLIYGIY